MRKAIKKLLRKTFSDPAETLSKILHNISTTEDEKAQTKAVIERLMGHKTEIQAALMAFQVQNRSLLVAGWRPFIGWVCGFALANVFVVGPLLHWLFGIQGPELSLEVMIELVVTLLGLGTLRTVEKIGGKAN